MPDSPTARLGQPVTMQGEQVHTVVRAQRWAGGRVWRAKPRHAYVTSYLKVKALQPTKIGGTYYSTGPGRTRCRDAFSRTR
jgi:hypothetical protein